MTSLMAKASFGFSVLLLIGNCATFRPHEPIPIYPEPIERKQQPTPKEELPDDFDKLKDEDKPLIIKMMRDDLQRASDYIEGLLRNRREKRDELESLEPEKPEN